MSGFERLWNDDWLRGADPPVAPPTRYAQVPTAPSYETQVPEAPPVSRYAQVPSSPASTGYSQPPATAGPTDDEIDSLLAGGGRLSSAAMRRMELRVRKREGTSPKLPPAPPGIDTEAKRAKATRRIPKIKNTDSEGGDLRQVASDDGGLVGKKLAKQYEGEDTHRAWRAGKREDRAKGWNMDPDSPEFEERWQRFLNSDASTTHYDPDTPRAREKSRLKERTRGRVRPTHKRRDFTSRDELGWVMDPSTADIHTFDPMLRTEEDGKVRNTHHSSPLAGAPVAGAGTMSCHRPRLPTRAPTPPRRMPLAIGIDADQTEERTTARKRSMAWRVWVVRTEEKMSKAC